VSPKKPHVKHNNTPDIGDDELLERVAWLHFIGHNTQSEIARNLNLSPMKVNRLVKRSLENGTVRIEVNSRIATCIALERCLKEAFDLEVCHVAPELFEEKEPMIALGQAGAAFLKKELSGGKILGLHTGATISAAVSALQPMDCSSAKITAVCGSISHLVSGYSHETVHRLARVSGAEAYLIHAPVYASSTAARDVFLAEPGISKALDLGRRANWTLCGVGIGKNVSGISDGSLSKEVLDELIATNPAAEIMGYFLDSTGNIIDAPTNDILVGPTIKELRTRKTVAIAGGQAKKKAIRAAALSGLLHGLITDESTAEALLR